MKYTARGYPYLENTDAPALDPYLKNLATEIDADITEIVATIPTTGDAAAVFRTFTGPTAHTGTSGAMTPFVWIPSAGDQGNALGITMSSAGVFSVTKPGVYQIDWQGIAVSGQIFGSDVFTLRKNGVAVHTRSPGNASFPILIHRNLSLVVGDTFDCSVPASSSRNFSNHTLDIVKLGA